MGSTGLAPFLVDSSERSGCLLFEVIRTDIAKVTVSSFSVVEHLNVFEHVGPPETENGMTFPQLLSADIVSERKAPREAGLIFEELEKMERSLRQA